MPQDQIARLRNQASQLGAAELSRAADITNTALTEMTGATSSQLHLELLCARILLPSSEDTTRGVIARVVTQTGIELLRASWPEIVNALADIRRVAWFTVQRGTPESFDGKVLRIMFDAEGDLMNFPRFEDDLRQVDGPYQCRSKRAASG